MDVLLEGKVLLDRAVAENGPLLAQFDPDVAIKLLDSTASGRPYHEIIPQMREFWSAISGESGKAGFDAFQRITMLRLIGQFESRAVGKGYSENIRSRFAASFARITRSIADATFDKYTSENDILLKDLGICRQKLIPAGAQVLETDSGFARGLMFRGGMRQGGSMVALLLRAGGNKPFYQIHTHLSELEEFSPDGWNMCYCRIAEMLELHPEIKGMWGGSWFYDPALETISPNLVYLRQVPQSNGAYLFYSNVSIDGGALSRSKKRQDLYKQGSYLPKAYALIWHRRDLIKWARRFAQERSRAA